MTSKECPAGRNTAEDDDIAAAADAYWIARVRRDALPDDLADAELDACSEARMGAYRAVMAMPASTICELGMKARIYRVETAPLISDYMSDTDIYSLLSDIERLVEGASS